MSSRGDRGPAISAAMRKRHIEDVRRWKEEGEPLPTERRCPRCRTSKPIEEWGAGLKRRTKSGLITVRPRPYCKKCEARRVADWKARKKAEGTWDVYEARRSEARKIPERAARRREYFREYMAARRRKEGVKPQPNRRRPPEDWAERYVPCEPISPLIELLESEGFTRREIGLRAGVEERRIYDMRFCASANTSIDNVDRVLMTFNRERDLEELYPLSREEAAPPLRPYTVLDPDGVLDR